MILKPLRQPAGRRRSGFTMIEMLGVLAIIMALAAVAAKNVLESVKTARRDSEVTTMSTLAESFRASVLENKCVPTAANWHTGVFANLNIAPNKVTNTTAGTRRVLLYDPAFRVGTNTTSVPPYTQTSNGSLQPVSPRVVLLSSLIYQLPSLGTDSATFSNIWFTPRFGVPDGWAAAWGEQCPDLRIERMDLRDLFCCVVLENLDTTTNASYSLETGTDASVPAGGRRELWVFKTTVLNLNYADNTLQAREYVNEDVSYTYEYGAWGRYARYGPTIGAGWFGTKVDEFLQAAKRPPTTQVYSKQQWVVDAMHQFLYNFGQWSLVGFPSTNSTPAFLMSCAATNALITFGNDLIR